MEPGGRADPDFPASRSACPNRPQGMVTERRPRQPVQPVEPGAGWSSTIPSASVAGVRMRRPNSRQGCRWRRLPGRRPVRAAPSHARGPRASSEGRAVQPVELGWRRRGSQAGGRRGGPLCRRAPRQPGSCGDRGGGQTDHPTLGNPERRRPRHPAPQVPNEGSVQPVELARRPIRHNVESGFTDAFSRSAPWF